MQMITAAPTTQPDYFSRGLSCTADQITEMALAWGGGSELYSIQLYRCSIIEPMRMGD